MSRNIVSRLAEAIVLNAKDATLADTLIVQSNGEGEWLVIENNTGEAIHGPYVTQTQAIMSAASSLASFPLEYDMLMVMS